MEREDRYVVQTMIDEAYYKMQDFTYNAINSTVRQNMPVEPEDRCDFGEHIARVISIVMRDPNNVRWLLSLIEGVVAEKLQHERNSYLS